MFEEVEDFPDHLKSAVPRGSTQLYASERLVVARPGVFGFVVEVKVAEVAQFDTRPFFYLFGKPEGEGEEDIGRRFGATIEVDVGRPAASCVMN